eukprot:5968159-Pleurochrysis_carterae.AAC.2
MCSAPLLCTAQFSADFSLSAVSKTAKSEEPCRANIHMRECSNRVQLGCTLASHAPQRQLLHVWYGACAARENAHRAMRADCS